jgi:hypothetical protein
LFRSLFAQEELRFWSPNVAKLGNYKSSFALGLADDEAAELKTQWRSLGEAPLENKPYAGTFAKPGYELGYFIRISPEKGFVLFCYNDEDMIVDFSFGTVTETSDGEFLLHPKRELSRSYIEWKRTPLTWVPVMGGRFVVPVDEIRGFGDYYGGFGIYNGYPRRFPWDGVGTFARRVDEREISEKDFIAPQKFLRFIRQPIEGSIISVGRKYKARRKTPAGLKEVSSVTKVRINVGSAARVRVGLMFLLAGPGDSFSQILKVLHVGGKTSDAEVIRDIDKSGNEVYQGDYSEELHDYLNVRYPPIRVGQKITTSMVVNN